jgi:hypothetical protein
MTIKSRELGTIHAFGSGSRERHEVFDTEEPMKSRVVPVSGFRYIAIAFAVLCSAAVARAQSVSTTDTTAQGQGSAPITAVSATDSTAQGPDSAPFTAVSATDSTAQGRDSAPIAAVSTTDSTAQLPGSAPFTAEPRRPAYWASIGGFEGDSNHSGYGFFGPSYVHPVTRNMAYVAELFGNYLYYQYPQGSGMATIHSPGASLRGGVRFGERNWFQMTAGPSFKDQHKRLVLGDGTIATRTDMRVGLGLGADTYLNPTSHSVMMGIVSYGAEDKYTWGMVNYKEQISNRNWHGKFAQYVGAEFVAQGNRDISSRQVGGFVEFLHVPSTISVSVGAGYKQSTTKIGPKETGPYFSVGFYQRLK